MAMFVMLFSLHGSYGFTGGASAIQGFHSLAACQKAIPTIRKFYPSVDKIECVALPAD